LRAALRFFALNSGLARIKLKLRLGLGIEQIFAAVQLLHLLNGVDQKLIVDLVFDVAPARNRAYMHRIGAFALFHHLFKTDQLRSFDSPVRHDLNQYPRTAICLVAIWSWATL